MHPSYISIFQCELNLILNSCYLAYFEQANTKTMLSTITPQEELLITRIRNTRSEAEANKIIEQSFSEIARQSGQEELLSSYCTKMNRQLGMINPMYIDDAEEWNIIQASKVFFYRIGSRYHSGSH